MSEIIHLYHTNDVHSHFENWPRIAHFLQKRKNLHQETGEEILLLDIGDHVDRWHPYTEGTLGKGNVSLLNESGYQYVTIGNNEGITLPNEVLSTLYDQAEFKVLVANLYNKKRIRPKWAHPYFIHTTNHGTRIALIGVTAYFHKFYENLGWYLNEPFAELQKQLKAIHNQADFVVVLSHLGIHDDERMAAEFPEVDVILGAHTHHILHQGKMVGNSLLCGAGKYGQFVGHVEIELDANQSIIRKKAQLYDTNELEEAPNEDQWVENVRNAGEKELEDVIAILPEPIENDWFQPSPLPKLLCESLKEWTNADCAFLNAGLLLEALSRGPVTKGDIHRTCPHPINPCVIELNGAELKEVILQSRDEEWPHIQLKGLGFRGTIMGMMVYEGIDFVENDEGLIKKVMINGNELQADQTYKLAIPDMFTFGRFFPQIKRTEAKEYFMPEFLRDLLAWKLGKE
ncbi:bifunctional metallophosphatase/5'-nucleotidase [Bacillus cihuensis]|uniref:bifunctional metallophosphatase/5'-nucleotidase n=1 Tax=Bacillus cihuensis TaxID=1208599 RepID=UPI000402F45C|nr:bifunctional UDP-sugar hydrolase/5'-nucleotidase [Bacillus cihuensis]